MESFALAHGLKRVPGPDPQYDDICFGQAPPHDDMEALSGVFPSMEIQFDQVGLGGLCCDLTRRAAEEQALEHLHCVLY